MTIGGLARELSYSGAVVLAASNRVTATGELIGRWIDSPGGIGPVSSDTSTVAGVQTLRLLPDSSTLHMLTLAPGMKWNLSDTWVLGVSLSIPLTNGGLTSPITPLVALDYAFGR